MKISLTERYIAATVNELPTELHADVRPELEASIADAVDARMATGEDRETAERSVLTELGDPAVLAAGYADRPLQLIGPRYYLTWWRLLKRLLIIILPIVFVVVIFAQLLASGDIGTIAAEAITVTMTTALHVCFWVTLAFAIMERTNADPGVAWDVDQLPEPRQEHPGRADLIASLIFLGLLLVAIVWDQVSGVVPVQNDSIPVLNPDLWPWVMTGLLGLIVLEMMFAIVLYLRRGWDAAMAFVNTVLNLLFFSWAITLLARGELFSGEFLDLFAENNVESDSLYTLAVLLGVGIGAVCVGDIIDGWVKTYRAKRALVDAT